MEKLTLNELCDLCKLNLDKRHVQDVLETITTEEFRFQPGIVLPQEHIASLYKLRFKIAKETATFDVDYLADYENLVSNLQNSISPTLGITDILIKGGGYLIFYEPNSKIILGVLNGSELMETEQNINS
jgi:hypothetical protein